MRASLDTNVIIHLYRAGLQNVLFQFFDEGVFIYEQIRYIELVNHGEDILELVDQDIENGNIKIYTDQLLKDLSVYTMFKAHVNENRILYGAGDLGEVYAISLAQTLGAYSLVTDDTKQGGPYMSLLQFEDDIMPFTFVDVMILRFLIVKTDALEIINDFDKVNSISELNWSFESQLKKFVRRFLYDPYRKKDTEWIQTLCKKYGVNAKDKIIELNDIYKKLARKHK